MKKQLTKILSELNWGGYNIQPGTVVTYKDFPAFKTESQIKESEDHEVSMAQSSLDAIIKYANHLKSKLGTTEKDIPAWIQDHIAKAENYIQQSANNYHEYTTSNTIGESKYKDGEWVAYMELKSGGRLKLLKVLKSGLAAKMWMTKNSNKYLMDDEVRSIGTMTKDEWDKFR